MNPEEYVTLTMKRFQAEMVAKVGQLLIDSKLLEDNALNNWITITESAEEAVRGRVPDDTELPL